MTAREIVEKWVDFPLQVMAEMRADIEALVEAEREACAKIGDDRIEEVNRIYPAQPGSSPEWHEKATRLTEINHYRSMIRTRGGA